MPQVSFRLSILVLLTLISLSTQAYLPGKDGEEEPDRISAPGVYEGYTEAAYNGYKYHSLYLTMRDSAELAVDYFLPKKLEEGKKVPTIVYLTRYVRSLKAKWPFNWIKHPILAVVPEKEIDFFTSRGYACVIVDVRGSGASTGARTMEFSPQEVKDGHEVVDWIIEQPWSDGQVASTGVSYVGTTAELLLVNQHPAVKACVPRSNIFDLYNHMLFPGGVRQGPFVKIWGFTTQSLDGNNLAVFGKKAKRLVRGINPVKGERKMLKHALKLHQGNFDVYDGIFKIDYRDQNNPGTDLCANDYSIHSNIEAIEESGTSIFRIGGWYDGALCKSVIEGYWNTDNTERVLIGPWDHGPHDNTSPFAESKEVKFDVLTEILRFFDYELKGIDNGIDEEEPFHYYTIGEEKWKATDTWPPEAKRDMRVYFSDDNTLVDDSRSISAGKVEREFTYTNTTGPTTRWNSQTGLYKNGPTDYPERSAVSETLLTFTMKPLDEAMEITGHTIMDLYISSDTSDAVVFCYLEDVAPDGSVTYVTEGMFRAIHRSVKEPPNGYRSPGPYHSFKKNDIQPLKSGKVTNISFDLLPISYQFKKGHSVRIAIAGADVDHFDNPKVIPDKLTFYFAPEYPSSITLPVVPDQSTDLGAVTD